MNMLKKLPGRESSLLALFSFSLLLNSLVFLSQKISGISFLNTVVDINTFYFLYFVFTTLSIGTIYLSNEDFHWLPFIKKMLLVFLPTQIVFLYGLQTLTKLTPLIGAISALYFLVLLAYVIRIDFSANRPADSAGFAQNMKKWLNAQGWFAISLVVLVMALNLGFGLYHLGKFAAVDEPLWTFDRIPDFWKNVGQGDWYNSRVSDKPGLTVAWLSGIGLLEETSPKRFEHIAIKGNDPSAYMSKIEKFNVTFRLPIFLFTVLMIPLFYLLTERLAGKKPALFATVFIGLSPILIGNSQIINPDSLLWTFAPLSLLSYLVYLSKGRRGYLYMSAVILALAILTKYTANILFIFTFILIFLEYIFSDRKEAAAGLNQYMKKSMADFGVFVFIALSLFYILYPAVWEKPERVLIGTIYSQAFAPVWPLFAGFLALALADTFLLKSRILSFVNRLLLRMRKFIFSAAAAVFLISAAVVFVNVFSKMSFFDFDSILSSPKSSYSIGGALGIFFANFYTLIFGVSPIALILVIVFLGRNFLKNSFEKSTLKTATYLLLFIIAYYAGSVASHVASIIRYQLILFPVFFVIAGIAAAELSGMFFEKSAEAGGVTAAKQAFFPLLLVASLAIVVFFSEPFYMGYTSSLLPQAYYLDLKDMGEGSYEAAQYLNSLPGSSKLNVWTDKNGVCTFFIGHCTSSLTLTPADRDNIDYLVLSSGRESRTTRMSRKLTDIGLDFSKLYESGKADYYLEINGRPGNYIKIIKNKDAVQ